MTCDRWGTCALQGLWFSTASSWTLSSRLLGSIQMSEYLWSLLLIKITTQLWWLDWTQQKTAKTGHPRRPEPVMKLDKNNKSASVLSWFSFLFPIKPTNKKSANNIHKYKSRLSSFCEKSVAQLALGLCGVGGPGLTGLRTYYTAVTWGDPGTQVRALLLPCKGVLAVPAPLLSSIIYCVPQPAASLAMSNEIMSCV